MSDEPFISRWSRRKIEAKAEPQPAAAETGDRPLIPREGTAVPADGISGLSPVAEAEPLPAVESLTLESDFTPFMRPGVDADVKRRALKTLLADPRFNVMDRLDVYIDDYSQPDPLPAGWLEKMNAYARLDDWKTVEATQAAEAAVPEEIVPLGETESAVAASDAEPIGPVEIDPAKVAATPASSVDSPTGDDGISQ